MLTNTAQGPALYYEKLSKELEALFGAPVTVNAESITIGDRACSIVDDVIILTDIDSAEPDKKQVIDSFGREWESFSDRKPEHEKEFHDYFDLIDLQALEGKTCADFGCGMGRWSQILLEKVQLQTLVAVDYSDAIFVARNNLRDHPNIIFIKADLETISFTSDALDFSYCLGVLHHIPSGIETAAKNIAGCSKEHLCYLYYDFENRGVAFRTLFKLADLIRVVTAQINSEALRVFLSHVLTVFAYYPFVLIAGLMKGLGLNNSMVPLFYYAGYSYERIRQDAYDRFFTPVEIRFSRQRINEIFRRLYSNVIISENLPYWHFHCR